MDETNSKSEFAPVIIRARIGNLNIYEISEGELEILEKGPPGSIFLNFAIFLMSMALTLIIALLTIDINSNLTYIIFVLLTIIGFVAGILLLLLWYRDNKSINKLTSKIRKRLPREEVPKMRRTTFPSKEKKN